MPIIVGIVLILGCCAAGFTLSGGQLMALFQPFELLIIGGSAIGAMFISNPLPVSIKVLTSFGSLFKNSPYSKTFYIDALSLLYEIFNKMLMEGVIIRAMASYGFPTCIRVNAGTRPENEKFIEALKKVL